MQNFDKIKVGDVLKFGVASRSHVSKPYFVEVIAVDSDSITTSIPHLHSTKIPKNMRYHSNRAKYIGTIKENKNLVYDTENGRFPGYRRNQT